MVAFRFRGASAGAGAARPSGEKWSGLF